MVNEQQIAGQYSVARLLVVLSILGITGCSPKNVTELPPKNSPAAVEQQPVVVKPVTLSFKMDDSLTVTASFAKLDAEETVETLMRKFVSSGISPKIELSGTGTTAFLQSIGGQDTSAGKGWTYKINGQRAVRGIGQTPVTTGDEITWEYGSW